MWGTPIVLLMEINAKLVHVDIQNSKMEVTWIDFIVHPSLVLESESRFVIVVDVQN